MAWHSMVSSSIQVRHAVTQGSSASSSSILLYCRYISMILFFGRHGSYRYIFAYTTESSIRVHSFTTVDVLGSFANIDWPRISGTAASGRYSVLDSFVSTGMHNFMRSFRGPMHIGGTQHNTTHEKCPRI